MGKVPRFGPSALAPTRAPFGTLATLDSIVFIAQTSDSIAGWQVQPGTFVPGPLANSIRVTWPADSLTRWVQVRLLNALG